MHDTPLRLQPLKGLLGYAAIQVTISFGYINYFRRSFNYELALVPLHLALVAGLLAASLLASAALLRITRARRTPTGRLLAAAPPVAVSGLLATLYVVDYIANYWWGSNMTHPLAWQLIVDSWRGPVPAWLYPALAVCAAAWVGVGAAAARPVLEGIEALARPWRGPGSRRRTLVAWATMLLVASGGTTVIAALALRAHRSDLLTSDPIVAFARRSTEVHDETRAHYVSRLRERYADERRTYVAPATFERRNVVIIIADSLRPDHMQAYGYERPTTPFLSSLIASGQLRKVEAATSTCAESNCGILSTLSSQYLPEQVPEAFKLHDLLRDQGYHTHFVLSGNHDWYGLRQAYGRDLTTYFDGRDSRQFSSSDDRVIAEGLDRIPSASGTPAFFYIHLMSPHLVGLKQERYRVFNPSNVLNDWDALFSGKYDRATVVNNYDNGVVQADAVIRDVFATLDRKGYLADSLVVILADHGEGLGDRARARFGHVSSLFQEFIRIPLLVYDRPDAVYRNLERGGQIDVAPTILDRLGLPVPASWRGRSLASVPAGAWSFHQTRLQTPAFAVIRSDAGAQLKYMYWTQTRREELYDLIRDPGEQHDILATTAPALVHPLRDRLAEYRAR